MVMLQILQDLFYFTRENIRSPLHLKCWIRIRTPSMRILNTVIFCMGYCSDFSLCSWSGNATCLRSGFRAPDTGR
jgi:hypothetical protein